MPIVPGTNPALQTWNGQDFVVADGSAQNPITLPYLQKNSSTPSFLVGSDSYGKLAFYNKSYNYGAFYSTITQASGGTTTANLVSVDSVDVTNGISLGGSGKIVFSNSGTYFINFLGQFRFLNGASGGNITVWYSVNGVQASNSSYTFYLPTSNNYQVLANVEDINNLNAGDYIQFYWWSDINPPANVSLTYIAAGTNPTRPPSPSVNINITQIA
jgi:hypothetical protein